jgi:hypothetical protein
MRTPFCDKGGDVMSELPEAEVILASAAQFLVEGGEEDAASVLLSCSLELYPSGSVLFHGDLTYEAIHVILAGPRAAYDILINESHPVTEAIQRALQAVLPVRYYIRHFDVQAQHIDIDSHWRDELLGIARGVGVHNQAAQGRALRVWKNLYFRSESEIRIADALDRAGVLYFPNCRGRLGPSTDRKNREADFLICYEGRWGILEVDGEPFHPPTRTAEDHARDREFREFGVRLVEHFDATECYQDPDEVVKQFLKLLERS